MMPMKYVATLRGRLTKNEHHYRCARCALRAVRLSDDDDAPVVRCICESTVEAKPVEHERDNNSDQNVTNQLEQDHG